MLQFSLATYIDRLQTTLPVHSTYDLFSLWYTRYDTMVCGGDGMAQPPYGALEGYCTLCTCYFSAGIIAYVPVRPTSHGPEASYLLAPCAAHGWEITPCHTVSSPRQCDHGVCFVASRSQSQVSALQHRCDRCAVLRHHPPCLLPGASKIGATMMLHKLWRYLKALHR